MVAQIFKMVDEYLIGYRTVREIETWLAAQTQLIHKSGEQRAIQLANQLEADLIDLSEGLLDEASIRERWDGYLSQASTVILEAAKPAVQTLTSTETTTSRFKYATPYSDMTVRLRHQFVA